MRQIKSRIAKPAQKISVQDRFDILLARRRANEPRESWATVRRRLIKRGKLARE